MIQRINISFKARFTNNERYKNACYGAYLRYKENIITEGETRLASADFPNHKLKLLKDGILNKTTKITHKFPWVDAIHMPPADNLIRFYRDLLPNSESEFIKKLFK